MHDRERQIDNAVINLLASRLAKEKQRQIRREWEGKRCNGDECGKLLRELGEQFSREEKESARSSIMEWKKKGYRLVSLSDCSYPSLLRETYEPPLVLFYKGMLPEDWNSMLLLSIVGTRRPDPSGVEIARNFSSACSLQGICIVSGLAMGIDAAAHAGAIDAASRCGRRNPTIAVLAHGLDTQYPAVNTGLYGRIVDEGGLLITQYEPGEKPFPSRFLERNRIIAGLSRGVVVVQAGRRSGALVTARYALEEGREVMAVPGGINDPRYEASNSLIRDGAHLVRSADDIFDVLGLTPAGGHESDAPPLTEMQQRILKLLRECDSAHYDDLASECGSRALFAHEVLQLELSGMISRRPGNMLALPVGS